MQATQPQSFTQQPYLFDMAEFAVSHNSHELRVAGKLAVDALLKTRREFKKLNIEQLVPVVNLAIDLIRQQTRLSDTQREELVLFCIEKRQATSIGEIAEDLKLSQSVVKDIVTELGRRGILYKASRHIPGCSKPNWLIKSRRVKNVEAV